LGKQRSRILRRKATELLKLFPEKFTKDFDNNKKVLNELDVFQSRTDRNIVAGILVGVTKREID